MENVNPVLRAYIEHAKNIKKKIKKIARTDVMAYRGFVMHNVLEIEQMMDSIISGYFCGPNTEKGKELLYCLLRHRNVALSAKFATLSFILKKYHKAYLKHEPDVLTLLNGLITHRNDCAHNYFDPIHDANDDGPVYKLNKHNSSEGKLNTIPVVISAKEMTSRNKEIVTVKLFLLVIHAVMGLELPDAYR